MNVRILLSAANIGRKSLANVVLPLDDGPERPIMMVLLAEDCPAWLLEDILLLLPSSIFIFSLSLPTSQVRMGLCACLLII
jgi:hypothetical protein